MPYDTPEYYQPIADLKANQYANARQVSASAFVQTEPECCDVPVQDHLTTLQECTENSLRGCLEMVEMIENRIFGPSKGEDARMTGPLPVTGLVESQDRQMRLANELRDRLNRCRMAIGG